MLSRRLVVRIIVAAIFGGIAGAIKQPIFFPIGLLCIGILEFALGQISFGEFILGRKNLW